MKKRGFTLIEMLIVIIIIGILAATLIPRIGNARSKASDVARVADVRSISTALIAYGLENTAYPTGDHIQATAIPGITGSNYGLPTIPDDPDAPNKHYYYKRLSGNNHFVVCANVINTSAGNTNTNYATGTNALEYSSVTLGSEGSVYCYLG